MIEEQNDMQKLSNWISKRWNQLKRKVELIQTGKTPVIDSFYTDEIFLTEQGKIALYWEAGNYHYLEIDQRVGEVTGRNQIILKLAPEVRSYTLTAYGGFQKVRKTIEIAPVHFRDDRMPFAEINAVQVDVKLPKLRAKHSEGKKKGRTFQQAIDFEVPHLNVRLPLKPQNAELDKLRSELREAFKIKEIAVLEARLAELKQTDLLEKLGDIDYNEAAVLQPSKLRKSH